MSDNLQWKVGDLTVTRVVESVAHIPPAGLLPERDPRGGRVALVVAPTPLRRRRRQPRAVDPRLRRSPRATASIIVDTCIGNDRRIPGMEALNLQTPFLDDLAAAGFPREEVDTVICTHLHFDHVGWNTMLVDGEVGPDVPERPLPALS